LKLKEIQFPSGLRAKELIVGVHFKAVLRKGAADCGQQTRLVTTSIAFDALEKSREHPSSDTITFQLSAKEWRERFNAEVAIREALEIEMIGMKGENAELLTEMKALREEEATRIQELEKALEVLLKTSHILQERALKACEDSSG
jgi:ClpP class serine protease